MMPTYEVRMCVTHEEVWQVEADNPEVAADLFDNCAGEVITDDTGGEVVDWKRVGKIKKIED